MKSFLPIYMFFSLLGYVDLQAKTYYVSPLGDDINNGSITSPLKTINIAFEKAQTGDTICLRAGEYHQQIESIRAGSSSKPITLINYPNEIPYIDGKDVSSGNNGVIIGHDYIRVVGLKVLNWRDSGIFLLPNIGFNQVRNCEVYECGSCLDLYQGVHDFIIDSVDLHDFAEESHGFDATSHDGTPIYNGLISNSKSHDGKGGNCDGFALGHDRGYISFGDVHSIKFLNCQAYNVGDGFDISGKDIILERCLAHDTFYGGNYKLWASNPTLINCIGYGGGTNVELDIQNSPPVIATLYNCTFYNGENNNIAIQTDSCKLIMVNCIVAGGNNVGIRTEMPFKIGNYEGDYNLFHCGNTERMFADPNIDISLAEFQTGIWQQTTGGQDSHSKIVATPNIVFRDTNSSKINLRLKSESPAINSGIIIPQQTPNLDYDNTLRNDGIIDIGAFEYNPKTGLNDEENSISNHLYIYPNPCKKYCWIENFTSDSNFVNFQIFDALGNYMMTCSNKNNIINSKMMIDVSTLSTGLYFVYINSKIESQSAILMIH
ncbi:MAG: T9SS type A sorting domain-containing protein [Bacteroidetes bacterium]|nr:T9SS type A sorting domain-containing protein [Bacteroidota bacterium]